MTLSRRRLRHFWVQFHLWPGLLLGAVFALLGLTGSVLCFYPELDLWLNPAQQVTASRPELPGVQRMVDVLHAAYPAHQGAWRLEMPLSAGRPINARYYPPPETAGRGFAPLMLTLDPATLNVTSARYWGDYAMTWLYDLHYSLLLERPGRITVGVLGIVCLLSLFSGLYLWWPGRGQWLKALRLQIRPGTVRATYDWHTLAGVYGLLFLLGLAFTGAVLALPEYVRPLIEPLSPLFKTVEVHSGSRPGQPMIAADQAVSLAQALFPQGTVRWVETPRDALGVFRVNLWQPGEPGYRFPRTHVWIDAYSGDVLAIRDPRDPRRQSAGDTFLDWQHPLHNGEAFGLPGRILACIAGLLPALLWVTGLMRWLHKRRARLAMAARR